MEEIIELLEQVVVRQATLELMMDGILEWARAHVPVVAVMLPVALGLVCLDVLLGLVDWLRDVCGPGRPGRGDGDV